MEAKHSSNSKVSQSGKCLDLATNTGYWKSLVLKYVFPYLHTEILKISSCGKLIRINNTKR